MGGEGRVGRCKWGLEPACKGEGGICGEEGAGEGG